MAGAAQRRRSGLVVTVDGGGFSIPHLSLPTGASLTWRFPEPILHDATFASGPQSLGALPTEDGATVNVRLRVPGRYRFVCSLHPMTMHEVVDVGGHLIKRTRRRRAGATSRRARCGPVAARVGPARSRVDAMSGP